MTKHEFDVVQRYRDLGGNLAFLSANDFFYAVTKHGDQMDGRTRWRDIGRPEASLVGAQYVDWNHDEYPNRPYRVGGHDGGALALPRHRPARREHVRRLRDRDRRRRAVIACRDEGACDGSPNDVRARARSAEMTYYETPTGAKVFSAGVMNFGGSALWPQVRTMVANLMAHLSVP